MRRFLALALALLALPACFASSPSRAQCGRPSRVRSDAQRVAEGILLVAEVADLIIAVSTPPPPPPYVEPNVAPLYPFDREAAVAALERVTYLDCGQGGVVDLRVTFKPSGAVREVLVVEGELDEKVEACVVERFGAVRVERFHGVPRALRLRIRLHDPVAM